MKYEADYVVVGAGAAGSVVAARLAEDGTRSVIVVEAGPDNTADPTIAAAAKFPFLLDMPAAVGPHPSPSHWGFVSKQNGKEDLLPARHGSGRLHEPPRSGGRPRVPPHLRRVGAADRRRPVELRATAAPSSRRWRTSTCRTSMKRCMARPAGCTSSARNWRGASNPICCTSRCRSTGCHSGTISTTTRGTLRASAGATCRCTTTAAARMPPSISSCPRWRRPDRMAGTTCRS